MKLKSLPEKAINEAQESSRVALRRRNAAINIQQGLYQQASLPNRQAAHSSALRTTISDHARWGNGRWLGCDEPDRPDRPDKLHEGHSANCSSTLASEVIVKVLANTDIE